MHESALEWVPRFLSHLAVERRLSPHTDANYKRDLERFIAHCDRNAVTTWERLDSPPEKSHRDTETQRTERERQQRKRTSTST